MKCNFIKVFICIVLACFTQSTSSRNIRLASISGLIRMRYSRYWTNTYVFVNEIFSSKIIKCFCKVFIHTSFSFLALFDSIQLSWRYSCHSFKTFYQVCMILLARCVICQNAELLIYPFSPSRNLVVYDINSLKSILQFLKFDSSGTNVSIHLNDISIFGGGVHSRTLIVSSINLKFMKSFT